MPSTDDDKTIEFMFLAQLCFKPDLDSELLGAHFMSQNILMPANINCINYYHFERHMTGQSKQSREQL